MRKPTHKQHHTHAEDFPEAPKIDDPNLQRLATVIHRVIRGMYHRSLHKAAFQVEAYPYREYLQEGFQVEAYRFECAQIRDVLQELGARVVQVLPHRLLVFPA